MNDARTCRRSPAVPRQRGVTHGRGAALALAALLAGCAGPDDSALVASRAEPPRADSLLLITIDTTRADRLGCYGYARAGTPNLDRIAAEGVLAQTAVAVAPVTLPSHASILTGLYPPRHGVRDNADFRLPDEALTLAEQFAAHGTQTAAVVGAHVLSSAFGIAQGFGSYDEPVTASDGQRRRPGLRHEEIVERRAGEVTDRAIERLDAFGGSPFFLWVHYFDPHQEYDPPPPFDALWAGRPYDGEIAYVDAEIGRLLAAVARAGQDGRTLVIVTSDHGESLGEHGEPTHGLFAYDATLRVPLLLRLPGVLPAGRRLERLISGVDLAPTALELLGVSQMPERHGLSFAREARGEDDAPRPAPAYAESFYPLHAYGWSALNVLRDERTKYIEAPQPELYDLLGDPGETRNMAAARPGELASWASRLAAELAMIGEPLGVASRPLDDEARRRLASLGYLSAPAPEQPVSSGADPKGGVKLHRRLLEAQARLSAGATAEALAGVRAVLRDDPANPAALALEGLLLFESGDPAGGVARLEDAARRGEPSFATWRNLGQALLLERRPAEAAAAFRSALALRPLSAEAALGLGHALWRAGDHSEAATAYRRAIASADGLAEAHEGLGLALLAGGDAEGAALALREAIDRDPGRAEAWTQLGTLAERAGRLDEARSRYEAALSASPDNRGALFGGGKLALRAGDLDLAYARAARLVELEPGFSPGRYLLALAQYRRGDAEGARAALRELVADPRADPGVAADARRLLAEIDR